MVRTKRTAEEAAEEGSMLEAALRRIRLGMTESALACRWVEDVGGRWCEQPAWLLNEHRQRMNLWVEGGGWKMVEEMSCKAENRGSRLQRGSK